jgi:hypothetical protein
MKHAADALHLTLQGNVNEKNKFPSIQAAVDLSHGQGSCHATSTTPLKLAFSGCKMAGLLHLINWIANRSKRKSIYTKI